MNYNIYIYDIINNCGQIKVDLNDLDKYLNQERYRIQIFIKRDFNNVKNILSKCDLLDWFDKYFKQDLFETTSKNFDRKGLYTFKEYSVINYFCMVYDNNLPKKQKGSLYIYGKRYNYKNKSEIIIPTLMIFPITIILKYNLSIIITNEIIIKYSDDNKFMLHNIAISNILLLNYVKIMSSKINSKNIWLFRDLLYDISHSLAGLTFKEVKYIKTMIKLIHLQLDTFQHYIGLNITFLEQFTYYNFINPEKYLINPIEDQGINQLQKYINDNYVTKFGYIKNNIKLYQLKDIYKKFTDEIDNVDHFLTSLEDKRINKLGIQSNYIDLDKIESEYKDNYIDDDCKCSQETFCYESKCFRGCNQMTSIFDSTIPQCIVKNNKCSKGIRSHIFPDRKWIICEPTINQFYIDKLIYIYSIDNLKRMNDLYEKLEYFKKEFNELDDRAIHTAEFYNTKNMSFLTILSTIFLPLTFISGWYGMNFMNMPELYKKKSYTILKIIVLLIVIFCLYYYHKDIDDLISKSYENIEARTYIY